MKFVNKHVKEFYLRMSKAVESIVHKKHPWVIKVIIDPNDFNDIFGKDYKKSDCLLQVYCDFEILRDMANDDDELKYQMIDKYSKDIHNVFSMCRKMIPVDYEINHNITVLTSTTCYSIDEL